MPVHHERGSTRVTCSAVASATVAGSKAGLPEHAANKTAYLAAPVIGFVSLVVMMLCSKIKVFGMVGVSILGGVAHNLAQLIIATFISQAPVILFYVPFLVVIGVLTGCVNGILANIIYKRVTFWGNSNTEGRNKEKACGNEKTKGKAHRAFHKRTYFN